MSAQSRRRTLRAVAPAAGLLAAGLLVWQGSYAAFSASTENTGNSWKAGQLNLDNSIDGGSGFAGSTSAVFSETALKPGDSGNRCITVRSGGDIGGAVRMYARNFAWTNNLQAHLTIKVEVDNDVSGPTDVEANCDGFSATSTPQPGVHLNGLPTTYAAGLGGWTAADGATDYAAYRITWTLDANPPSTVQGGTAKADFVWEVQS